MKTVLILGSNSDVGIAAAYKFAKEGFNLLLATRTIDQSQQNMALDLAFRHKITCHTLRFDANQTDLHQEFIDTLPLQPDVVLSVFAVLGDQIAAAENYQLAAEIVQTNFLGNVSILGRLGMVFKQKKSGTIICLSSVAGERGRKSNYIYGSSKAALTTYLSGLRADLASSGVHVITVIPGFIRTKMIGDLKTPGSLTASAKQVADAVFKANANQSNVVYVKGIWYYIMAIIRAIPEPIFKKLSF